MLSEAARKGCYEWGGEHGKREVEATNQGEVQRGGGGEPVSTQVVRQVYAIGLMVLLGYAQPLFIYWVVDPH